MKAQIARISYLIVVIPIVLSPLLYIPVNAYSSSSAALADTPTEPDSWPMAAANPERTSWTPEEVRGQLHPEWYKPFEPYIPEKVQIIAAYGMLYISTANGLYSLDAESGEELWVYPTELPLGHSPTIYNGIAYVGGFNRKLYAIDAFDGSLVWSFTANAGFETNPLVVEGKVLLGNRDGYFYAVDASTGSLAWKFKTGGPITYSAAYADGIAYFASNDSYAYAVRVSDGALIWKSEKLPGAGFYSWWPVIYEDRVIFSGSRNYRYRTDDPGTMPQHYDVFPNHEVDPKGTLIGPLGTESGDWVEDTPTIDTSQPTTTSNGQTIAITEYLESKPWQRTYFMLSRDTGDEITYDFDNDGYQEYAPMMWFSTYSGNRYPPVIGSDGVLYQTNKYMSAPYIPGGQISGWKVDTPFISIITSDWGAVDEPHAYSAGGDLIYWNLCCDREAGAIDISVPNDTFPGRIQSRDYYFIDYNLPDLIPGYNTNTYTSDPYYSPYGGVYGGRNGYYGFHGDVNPPIPYQGRVYMHRGNSVIAFSSQGGSSSQLPTSMKVETVDQNFPSHNMDYLISVLDQEIQKMIDAGHLAPGYLPNADGFFEQANRFDRCGDDMGDYWHSPAETIYTLLLALPNLPLSTQQELRQYIQQEFEDYPPYEYNHIGWSDGASREDYILTPEFQSTRANYPARTSNSNFVGWNLNPFTFYTLWKYAIEYGDAQTLFDLSASRLEPVPSDSILREMPFVHNAYIAGYIGYLELEKLAGYPESADIRNELNTLLQKKFDFFSSDAPSRYFEENGYFYCRSLNIARNFLFLVPELSLYLRNNLQTEVDLSIQQYEDLAPFWFVSNSSVAFAEGTMNLPYDYYALLQAKAQILDSDPEELQKFIDTPAVPIGDLYYIQNLVSAIESYPDLPQAPAPTITPDGGEYDDPVEFSISAEDPASIIRYTLDGSTPNSTSPIYQDPITLYQSTTVQAMTFLDGYTSSPVTSTLFTLNTIFEDVPFNYWAYDYIETLYQSGYVSGCSSDPPLYCPEQTLTRAESSVFILRGVYGAISDPPYSSPSTPTFEDVDNSFWGYGWIESLWQDGYTAGCGSDPLIFCPQSQHSRAEGSVFFLRMMNGVDYEPPSPEWIFSDVPQDAWYAAWVEATYNQGILPACNTDPLSFCPDDPLDRAWAAYMMVQAKESISAP